MMKASIADQQSANSTSSLEPIVVAINLGIKCRGKALTIVFSGIVLFPLYPLAIHSTLKPPQYGGTIN